MTPEEVGERMVALLADDPDPDAVQACDRSSRKGLLAPAPFAWFDLFGLLVSSAPCRPFTEGVSATA